MEKFFVLAIIAALAALAPAGVDYRVIAGGTEYTDVGDAFSMPAPGPVSVYAISSGPAETGVLVDILIQVTGAGEVELAWDDINDQPLPPLTDPWLPLGFDPGEGVWYLVESAGPVQIPDGSDLFHFDLLYDGPGPLYWNLYDTNLESIHSLAIVPEPTTLAILAVGAVAIRRRVRRQG